jgi:hypothetical protein
MREDDLEVACLMSFRGPNKSKGGPSISLNFLPQIYNRNYTTQMWIIVRRRQINRGENPKK